MKLSETLWQMMLEYDEDSIEFYVLRKASREMKRYENRKYTPEGLSTGAQDKLIRKVKRYRANKVPRELWTEAEKQVEAYLIHGLACPSSNALDTVQETEKRKPEDVPEGKG